MTKQTHPLYTPDVFEAQALGTLNQEKTQWYDEAVFVTRKEQYLMRNLIEQSRRYYQGLFLNPYDEVTGEKKTWIPMTESAVESIVKSIDLDTKDILILPGNPSTVNITPIVRAAVLNLLEKIEFGQLLNDLTRIMARDGTVVIKNYVDIDPMTKKRFVVSEIVNLLNFYIDPSAKSIQDGPVIERTDKTMPQMEAYRSVWKNIDMIMYTDNVQKVTDMFSQTVSEIPLVELWERWGLIRKSWITKDHNDDDTWVEGHMIASGNGSAQVIHLIRLNPRKDGRKPYEECWYRRLDGRWYGKGVPEMLFSLQEYMNTIVNIRKANNMVLQNGIFLIRKGSGITPDMLSSITAGGGLPVTNINNDIKQLQVQDYRQSSYTDEDRVFLMADRVTNSFDINRGEVGRASASATATLTADRNMRDAFVLVQENIGFFIERLILKQYIPLLKEIMKENDLIKITGDADALTFIDDQIINNRKAQFVLDHIEQTGFYPEQVALDEFVAAQNKFLKGMGKQRFVSYFRTLFDEDYDIDVHVTDEKFNRVVAVQQLRDALLAYSRLPVASKLDSDAVLKEMFTIMGIKGEFFLEKPQLPITAFEQQQGPRPLKDMAQGLPTEVTATENANKIPSMTPGGETSTGLPTFNTRLNLNVPLTPGGQM